uniref:F-box domain-containing protein n=1 Tax=Alexandrium monilatum TaxID=311494 RepID=A0A7S4VLQ6_9DINO
MVACCSAPSARASCLMEMPAELLAAALPHLFDRARPVARLACAAPCFAAALSDMGGRLRVGSVITCRLGSLVDGLARLSTRHLEILRVDLSAESRERLCSREIELAVKQLSQVLSQTAALRVLAVRLASFDVSMGRLRLSSEAWEALTLGLGALARHRRLRSLELSSIAIKPSRATRAVRGSAPEEPRRQLRRAASSPAEACAGTGAGAGGSLTFLQALERLSELEELVLTYDEIFGSTARLLPSVFRALERLKRVDLAMNHISKEEMQAVRRATPSGIQLCGEDQQTFFFY